MLAETIAQTANTGVVPVAPRGMVPGLCAELRPHADAVAECFYALSPDRKRVSFQVVRGNRRATGRLSLDTSDMAGELVKVWLNGRLLRQMTAEASFTYEPLRIGDTLLMEPVVTEAPGVFNIRDFGAKGGVVQNTAAIQSAISACHAAGGGIVEVPAGRWLSGTLVLKSGVTLRLAADATIVGSTNIKDYPLQRADGLGLNCMEWIGERFAQALIYAQDAHDIALEGPGTIDGQGWNFPAAGYPGRPRVVQFVNCSRVTVDGVCTRNSASWTQHYINCEDMILRDVTVCSTQPVRNNDGIDLEACRDVVVTGCTVIADDDAYVVKGVDDRENRNILFIDCHVIGRKAAFKIGTESKGLFRNITVRKMRGYGTRGIGIYSVDRAVIENTTVLDVDLTDAYETFTIRLGNRDNYRPAGAPAAAGVIRGIWLDGIRTRLATKSFAQVLQERGGRVEEQVFSEPWRVSGSYVAGIPGYPVSDVLVTNVEVSGMAGGGTDADAHRPIPENAGVYPGGKTFGKLPCYALYLRHAASIRLENVKFILAEPDQRPTVATEDVQDLQVRGVEGTIANLPYDAANDRCAPRRFSSGLLHSVR